MPIIFASEGIIFGELPASILPIVNTAASRGSIRRDIKVCKCDTIKQATGTGSIVDWGRAACPPLPKTVISKVTPDAIIGPIFVPICPCGR